MVGVTGFAGRVAGFERDPSWVGEESGDETTVELTNAPPANIGYEILCPTVS